MLTGHPSFLEQILNDVPKRDVPKRDVPLENSATMACSRLSLQGPLPKGSQPSSLCRTQAPSPPADQTCSLPAATQKPSDEAPAHCSRPAGGSSEEQERVAAGAEGRRHVHARPLPALGEGRLSSFTWRQGASPRSSSTAGNLRQSEEVTQSWAGASLLKPTLGLSVCLCLRTDWIEPRGALPLGYIPSLFVFREGFTELLRLDSNLSFTCLRFLSIWDYRPAPLCTAIYL